MTSLTPPTNYCNFITIYYNTLIHIIFCMYTIQVLFPYSATKAAVKENLSCNNV